jgi:L-fuconolactonase
LADGNSDVWIETNKAIADYTEHEKAAILGGTAAKFYGIQAG